MSRKENNYKSFYGTLFACFLSISMGFFILFINEPRQIGEHTSMYASEILKIKPPLGVIIMLLIVGFAIILPIRLFFKYREKLESTILDDIFVISLGSLPFFMQNFVAVVTQFREALKGGEGFIQAFKNILEMDVKNNIFYAILYLGVLLFTWYKIKSRPKKS